MAHFFVVPSEELNVLFRHLLRLCYERSESQLTARIAGQEENGV